MSVLDPDVRWWDEPSVERAKLHRKMSRACWTPDPDPKSKTGRKIFDPYDKNLRHSMSEPEHAPRPYPVWGTTLDELTSIGGIGLRFYFALLRMLPFIFMLLGAIMSPMLMINMSGHMYKLQIGSSFNSGFKTMMAHQDLENMRRLEEETEEETTNQVRKAGAQAAEDMAGRNAAMHFLARTTLGSRLCGRTEFPH